jgi:hypothetical protein
VFTHTWTFPLSKQHRSRQSLDHSPEPSQQETVDPSTVEDLQLSDEIGETEEPGIEEVAVLSLGSELTIIAQPMVPAL